MGFANVRAGTRARMLVLVQALALGAVGARNNLVLSTSARPALLSVSWYKFDPVSWYKSVLNGACLGRFAKIGYGC